MSVLPIFVFDQPVLRKKAKTVRRVDETLARDMLETMQKANGIGLAANQVGSLQRVIVVDISGMEETREVPPMVMLNPVVVEEEGCWLMEEGCLSIPDIREEVERAEKIRVRFRDLEFAEREIEADGLLGRVILHEVDHLNGVLFFDYIGSVKRKLLHGRLNKLRRGDFEVAYPVVSNGVPTKVEVASR
ncbi:MAG: peptide deformylase [Bacteroidota bacterium]